MSKIRDALASSFEHLDLIVETFDKASGFTGDKIVQDFIPPTAKDIDETIEIA